MIASSLVGSAGFGSFSQPRIERNAGKEQRGISINQELYVILIIFQSGAAFLVVRANVESGPDKVGDFRTRTTDENIFKQTDVFHGLGVSNEPGAEGGLLQLIIR